MNRILIVDDEQDLCEILQFNLESEGYEVDTANSAEEALSKLNSQHILILLDVMMEDMSGFQMANKIRKELNNNVPIIFLTAKDTENDMLTGFNVGGDDYITKPFSLKAVMARVKAVLKRSTKTAVSNESVEDIFVYKSLEINFDTKKVMVNNVEAQLTRKEYMILVLLVQSPQRFFTREQILSQVWDDDTCVIERSVDVHIARLRKKLGTIGENIINRTGFGYSFDNS